jgi:regulator of PEP synthase PpsR (kinase-PPPase family)
MTLKRTAFFVSDRTGITAEMLGHSLLTQFDQVAFTEITLPFVDSPEKVAEAVLQINQTAEKDGQRPLVFSTLVNSSISEAIQHADAFYIDCFMFHRAHGKDWACSLHTVSAPQRAQQRVFQPHRGGQFRVVPR